MRRIGVVTVGRSDYGILLPVLRSIEADSELNLNLIVSGSHFSTEHGNTLHEIESDGFEVHDQVLILDSDDSPVGIARSMGSGVTEFGNLFASKRQPDILIVMGDRFEMHAAAVAALPFKIPIAHIHGGETTYGAIDESLRHSITKLSHIHFVATEQYAQRVHQMGEESWRIKVSGAPALDNLRQMSLFSPKELADIYKISVNPSPILVTFHPVTLEFENTDWHITELLAALDTIGRPVIFTAPNNDTHWRTIDAKLRRFVATHATARFVENLGTKAYFSLLASARIMVGNSSSGIIEAPSFGLPVVNVGTRQKGRHRAENVIDVTYDRNAIIQGINQALSTEFRNNIKGLSNPFGDGTASELITETLKTIVINNRLISKKFINNPDLTKPTT